MDHWNCFGGIDSVLDWSNCERPDKQCLCALIAGSELSRLSFDQATGIHRLRRLAVGSRQKAPSRKHQATSDATAHCYCLPPSVYCLLLTAHCLLPTAFCLLPAAYCLLLTAYCLLPTAYCLLPTAFS